MNALGRRASATAKSGWRSRFVACSDWGVRGFKVAKSGCHLQVA
jgi:hypothetical protein